MENLREQIKDLEINNLRCLNNYLSQTIDLLSHKYGSLGQGVSHSPYGVPCPPFGYMGPNVFPGGETSWTGGISHSPYTMAQTPFGQTPFGQTPFGMPVAPVYSTGYPCFVDWFGGIPRTGLSHSPSPLGWQPWPTYAIDPVRQQQVAQAMAARQGFEAFCRGVYG